MFPRDPDAAIEFLKSAAIENPLFYTPLGIYFYKKGLYIEADMLFRKALSNDKFDFVAAYYLAKSLEALNDREKLTEALSMYERAFFIFPWDEDIQNNYYHLKNELSEKKPVEKKPPVEEIEEESGEDIFPELAEEPRKAIEESRKK